jgi:hypothetical protein
MTAIVALVGFIGSGKDTVADLLVKNSGFVRDSFAHPLKQAVAAVFGWDLSLLEGITAESRAWREQTDSWWSQRLGIQNLSPRWILQQWGTEVCRNSFHSDIWIASLENRLRMLPQDTVISDARFVNELDAVRKLGGTCIRVRRGANPPWWDMARAANAGCTKSQQQLEDLGVHASESSWAGYEFDQEIDNSGTLAELEQRVKDLALNLR